MTKVNTNGRFSKGWAIVAVLSLLLAIPAAAGIIVQNFLRADIAVAAPCFVKSAGADQASTSGLLTFDGTTTVNDPAGSVDLLQETTTFAGFAGDRMLYSAALDFTNTCGNDLAVSFLSADDPAGGAAIDNAAAFANMDVYFYLPDPGGAAVPGLTGTWTEMLSVVGGTAVNGGTVTLANTATLTMAVIIDSDDGAAGTSGTLRWIAQADHG